MIRARDLRVFASAAVLLAGSPGLAQDADLAKQLSNPVASLISVPLQFNYDQNLGADEDGHRTTTNLQPVVPISLGEDWNLISRTIVPYIVQVRRAVQ